METIISYNVIARKYRPADFSRVVGQNHVVDTLKNAIASNRVAHAYLFSGPRGVGKTTVARILAKALNCTHASVSNRPCNACNNCHEVAIGSSYLYQEIDGASHRGIDGMREIKEELSYAATKDKWRIFVIDEVHMLTTEAFNAMLKSLEEPPPRVVFIFCTTESHRIPITVRSRTQHFQFKLLKLSLLQDILKEVVLQEKLHCEEEALLLIAKKAAGSIRDAENLLEQVIAFSREEVARGGTITQQYVLKSLSLGSDVVLKDFINNLVAGSFPDNHKVLHDLMLLGIRFEDFLYQIAEYLLSLLSIILGVNDLEALEVSEVGLAELHSTAKLFSKNELNTLSELVYETISELRHSQNERMTANFFLHKIHRYKNIISPEELRNQLLSLSAEVELLPLTSSLANGTQHSETTTIKKAAIENLAEELLHAKETVFKGGMPLS